MALLEDKATQIAFEMHGENPTVFIDPATILAIIGVIIQIIKAYKDCRKTPAEAKYHMDNIGWWNRWKLRRIIRAANGTDEVYSGILNHIRKTTIDDVSLLYHEV